MFGIMRNASGARVASYSTERNFMGWRYKLF